jgi:hypothetical protein
VLVVGRNAGVGSAKRSLSLKEINSKPKSRCSVDSLRSLNVENIISQHTYNQSADACDISPITVNFF